MSDPRWQIVRNQMLCEVDQGYDLGEAHATLDALEAEMERLREGIDLAVAMQNDRVEEVERLREAIRKTLE